MTRVPSSGPPLGQPAISNLYRMYVLSITRAGYTSALFAGMRDCRQELMMGGERAVVISDPSSTTSDVLSRGATARAARRHPHQLDARDREVESIVPGMDPMKVITATTFRFAALSLWLVADVDDGAGGTFRRLIRAGHARSARGPDARS